MGEVPFQLLLKPLKQMSLCQEPDSLRLGLPESNQWSGGFLGSPHLLWGAGGSWDNPCLLPT